MISVIIPVYNVEEYLDDCLTSVLAQTYSNLEILLINDGSTDNSGVICDKYAQMDGRVKVFHKENGGVSSARNIGLENATGQYIAFVDPDDWIELDMYETIINQFQNNNVDAVFCGYWEDYSSDINRSSIVHSPEKQGIVNGRDALYQCLIDMGRGYFTSVWNKVFKTEFIKNDFVSFEPFMIGEDEVWLTKILPKARKVYLVNTPFYHWLQRESSVLHSNTGYAKWYSALQSKTAVIEAVQFDQELCSLSKAKIYADEFGTIWKSYIVGDHDVSKDFMKKLKPYEKPFYKSENYSKLKRIKYWGLKWAMKLHCSVKIVELVGNVTKLRIKEIKEKISRV